MPTLKAAASTATAVDPSKLQKVTNNSGVSVSLCLPLTSAETENTDAIISYNKDFVILKTANNGTVLASGVTDTVTLDRTYIDSNTKKPEYSTGYDLLANTSGWLVPVANIPVVQDWDDDKGVAFYDDVIIPSTNKTAMDQTVAFYQAVACYPESQLTKNYLAAMNGAGSSVGTGSTQASIAQAVAAFFKTTDSYQQVTLANIVALEGYYERFPFTWASYLDTASYYLYSSDGNKTSFQGILSMSKSGNIDITKANGGYVCTFAPAVTPTDTTKVDVNTANAKILTYSNGLFVDDANSDLPQIAVKGSFQLKRTFTKDPIDTKVMVVVSGTIYGQTAVGFDQSQCTKADNTTQDWLNSLFHPKTAAEIFNSVMQILGALMMLHFVATTLWGIGKWIKEQAAAKDPVSDADLQSQKSKIESEFKAQQTEKVSKMSGNKESLPDTPESGVSSATEAKSTLSDNVSLGQAESNVTSMRNNLKNLEEYVIEDTTGTIQQGINESGTTLRELNTSISNADLQDLKGLLEEIRPQLQELSGKITELNTQMEKMVAENETAQMNENVENAKIVETNVENENQTAEDEAGDPSNPDPTSDPVEFPDAL